MKGRLVLPQEGPSYTDKNVYRESSAQPFPKGTPVFYQVTVHWWEGNTQTFWGQCPFPEHWLWTDTNPERTKMSLWPTSQRRDLTDVRLNSGSPSSGPSDPPNPSCGCFPSSRKCHWNRNTVQLVESPHLFPDLWDDGYYGRKCQVWAVRTALPKKMVNPKHYHIPGGIAELSATSWDLKDGISYNIPVQFTYLVLESESGLLLIKSDSDFHCSCCTRCAFIAWTN